MTKLGIFQHLQSNQRGYYVKTHKYNLYKESIRKFRNNLWESCKTNAVFSSDGSTTRVYLRNAHTISLEGFRCKVNLHAHFHLNHGIFISYVIQRQSQKIKSINRTRICKMQCNYLEHYPLPKKAQIASDNLSLA